MRNSALNIPGKVFINRPVVREDWWYRIETIELISRDKRVGAAQNVVEIIKISRKLKVHISIDVSCWFISDLVAGSRAEKMSVSIKN